MNNNNRKHKRGRLSKDEDKRIAKMIDDGKTADQIATSLNRSLPQIESYIRKFYGKGDNLPAKAIDVAEFTRQLRNSIHWRKLQEHYSKDDLEYYESIYANLMTQFKDDVSEVDDLQILQAIDAHMAINSYKKKAKAVNDHLLVLQREIDALYISGNDNDRLAALESQRQAIIAQNNQSTRVFTDLSKKFDDTVAKLKSTRDQRLKNAENSNQSWPALIKYMQEKKVKEREGRYAQMYKIASEKKSKELQQPYKYLNNEIDQPFLLPENVMVGFVGGGDDATTEEGGEASEV